MFGPKGNPSAANLFGVIAALQEAEGVNVEIQLHAHGNEYSTFPRGLRTFKFLNTLLVGAAEELFDFADVRGAGVGGKALDEDFSVLFFQDAIV